MAKSEMKRKIDTKRMTETSFISCSFFFKANGSMAMARAMTYSRRSQNMFFLLSPYICWEILEAIWLNTMK